MTLYPLHWSGEDLIIFQLDSTWVKWAGFTTEKTDSLAGGASSRNTQPFLENLREIRQKECFSMLMMM